MNTAAVAAMLGAVPNLTAAQWIGVVGIDLLREDDDEAALEKALEEAEA